MTRAAAVFIFGGFIFLGALFFVLTQKSEVTSVPELSTTTDTGLRVVVPTTTQPAQAPQPQKQAVKTTQTTTSVTSTPVSSKSAGPKVLSNSDLLAMAADTFANGEVPLGDDKYVTDAPKKGYIYLCNVHKDNPGSMVNGPWITGTTWNFLKKITIDGTVSWPSAAFSNIISGSYRMLTGNDLPTNHTTGVFPVAQNDDAHAYDPNPNTISAQTLKQELPLEPTYSSVPYCMGGEVGIMLSGVALFNGFDAGLRDAAAHELQDSCEGHPQGSGEYHYHSLSNCFKDIGVATVLGYAYDGFPITGPLVTAGKYLTTDDLDECHGITSEVVIDGKTKVTYHYVMTQDFPYSASCFRSKPMTTGPSGGAPQGGQGGMPPQGEGGHPPPPRPF